MATIREVKKELHRREWAGLAVTLYEVYYEMRSLVIYFTHLLHIDNYVIGML